LQRGKSIDPARLLKYVLAVHMICIDAPEIVQRLAVALTAGAAKAHFDRTLAVHPTAAEELVLLREPVRR
jgi:glutathione reductase (NADPH)